MRLVSAVCYHAARPGHTIDVKRVVDATVPMALTLWFCWTCQAFTDIARGKRRVASRAGGPRCTSQVPGQSLIFYIVRNGTSMFSGDVRCARGCPGVDCAWHWRCSLGSLFQVHLLARFQASGGSRFWTEYESVWSPLLRGPMMPEVVLGLVTT